MDFAMNVWKLLTLSRDAGPPPPARRRRRQAELSWDTFEDRVVLSRIGGGFRHAHALAGSVAAAQGAGGITSARGSANSALATAMQTLRTDVQTVQAKSGTTVAQLTAIRTAFQALKDDGLTPTSARALASFKNSLVTAFASGTTLTDNATLLAQFSALYTSTPTAEQSADLKAAYDALAAAVTASNITSSDLATVDADYAAVLAARGSTSTATYPYFSLVTGGGGGGRFGGGFGGGCR